MDSSFFDNQYNVVLAIVAVILAIWIVLKGISILFKLFILAATCGVLYFAYQYYPQEATMAGAAVVGIVVLYYLVKWMLFGKKDDKK